MIHAMLITISYSTNVMHKIKHFFSLLNSTPVAIILAAVILGASHLGYGYVISQGGAKAPQVLFKGDAISEKDLPVGDTKSKVVFLEYSDTECPFCAQLNPTIKQLKAEYASKVAFAYRYFPLTQIHPNSFEESRSVHCVGKELGALKKEEYVDALFDYKLGRKNMTLPQGMKESLAKKVGVNQTTYGTCMTSEESSNVVNASIQEGIRGGVQGTPASYVLVKGKTGYEVVSFIDGARPYEYFKAVLDDALTR